MTVSIIIAVKELNDNLKRCIEGCLNLDYPDFEIIVLPDKQFDYPNDKVRIIPTGNITPPQKRDLALKEAKGEILAFIDDDAYPDRFWLSKAVGHFKNNEIAAVGGPAITPAGAPFAIMASGNVYESILVSGTHSLRYLPKEQCYVDDYPSCNLIVRTSAMKELGGFNTNFWPGEDTFLCSGITDKLKKKIIYDPAALVYHQRRPLFLAHLKQVANYALHRGYFVKKGYKNCRRLSYFLPSFLLLGLVLGSIFCLIFHFLLAIYLSGIIAYLTLVIIFSLSDNLRLSVFKFFGIVLTHLTYGFFFFWGLSSKRMKEELQ